jgi:protein O-mannosyl-transferase
MIGAGCGAGVADRVEAPDRDAPARHTRRWWGAGLRSRRVAAAAVFLIALVAYLPSLQNDFAYDDVPVIQLDTRAHDLSRALRFFSEPYWQNEELGLYRPATSVSYALDWRISGGRPGWFHLVNASWNAAACALLFLFLAALAPLGAAFLGALVFAVHPVHVEAVANVVGRAELLAAAFSLAALVLWVRTRSVPLTPRLTAAVVALYALALLSKESAIMLPALLALADVARGLLTPRGVGQWLRLHALVLAALMVTAGLFVMVRTAVLGDLGPARVDVVLDIADSAGPRVLTALQTWPIILRLLFFPRTLLAYYGPPGFLPAMSLTPAALAGGLIIGGLVVGGVAAWAAGRGRLAFVLLFLPVALLPVSNLLLPVGVVLAERTLYLPSVALAAAVTFGAAAVQQRRVAHRMVLVAATVALPLLTLRSLARIPEWGSTEAVFAALRRDDPASARGLFYSAQVAAYEQNHALALRYYAQGLQTWPYRYGRVLEAAGYAAQVGDLEFARRVADFALGRWPDDVALIRLRAAIALDQADSAAATALIGRGLRVAPADSLLLRMRRAASGDDVR